MSDPTELTTPAIDPERLSRLRSRAAARLAGRAAGKGAPARAADALSVLHALAASPATAPAALALLHELQLHQIEIELQAQELRDSRAELETALRRQLVLYDGQPAGCFTIDAKMGLVELNQSGADMLGVLRGAGLGLSLDTFISTDSATVLRTAMATVDAGQRRAGCIVSVRRRGQPDLRLMASLAKDPAGHRYLLSLVEASDPLAC